MAKTLYRDLQKAGMNPWMDTMDLLPGQNWELGIDKAIKESSYFLALLSSKSVTKKGVVQKEIKKALEVFKEYAPEKTYIIPVRLEDCNPAYKELRDLHWADLFPSYKIGFQQILRTFKREGRPYTTIIHRDYELVRIPGGSFKMGSSESEMGRFNHESPIHEVRVPEFYLGLYPVTNEQYGRFLVDNKKMPEPKYWAESRFNQPRQPVVGVNWQDAQRYASWSDLRLPSEAEWEYACRAGTQTPYYAGSSQKDLNRAGWYEKNSRNQLHPVGEKEPNSFGLYEMHGNVFEWVEDDWHDDYKDAPADGRAWIEKPRGDRRVLRGGSWSEYDRFCRSACRSHDTTSYRDDDLGFRLARSATLEP